MKNKNFIIIVIGQIISLFGNAIQRFSMSLYVLAFTGSTVAFSRILAISTIPYILFAPIAGRLADKINRKKIMVSLDFFCAVLLGAYSIVLVKENDSQLIIGIVMFILSICYTLYGPAVTASIPQIVEEESLTSANGIINQVGSIVNFAGPILAGIVYGVLGIKAVVVINAISFFAASILELFLEIPDVEGLDEKDTSISKGFIKSSFVDMKHTFIYLRKESRVVLGIIVSYALCNIFLVPILSIIAPYFINVLLGLSSKTYGIVEGIFVLGMIGGGFLISAKPNLFNIKRVHETYFLMIAGVIVMSIVGFSKLSGYKAAGVFAVGGMAIMFALALSNVLTLTFIQKEIPERMLGSVSAFSTAVATASVAPGQLLFGYIIDTGVSMGIVLLVIAIINVGLAVFIKWNVRDVK